MNLNRADAITLVEGVNWIQVIAPLDGLKQPTADFHSDAISNDEDRSLLFAMRAQSDAIVVTKKTAIAENYRASKFAPIFVIDRDGLSPHFSPVAPADDRKGIALVKNIDEVGRAVSKGAPRILLESGRTYAAALASTGLVKRLILVVPTLDSNVARATVHSTLIDLGINASREVARFVGSQNTIFVLDAPR